MIGPTIEYDNTDNDQLNVDPTAGKSINAIRPFAGKGTLVWGARTLAGNDNEWRYVQRPPPLHHRSRSRPRRRPTPFVFEPNDATTWLKVKGMIESYLTGPVAGRRAAGRQARARLLRRRSAWARP